MKNIRIFIWKLWVFRCWNFQYIWIGVFSYKWLRNVFTVSVPLAVELFHIMRRRKAIPKEFQDATIIHLFKRKGNPQVCDYHRGIPLLWIAGKVIERVLLNRLNEHLQQSGRLPESQCLFRKVRRTTDMIFTAIQLHENCQQQNVDLYKTFLDLTKAFDSQLLGTLENYGNVWLSCLVYSNGVAVPRWYACKGPKWWRVFWSIPCDK